MMTTVLLMISDDQGAGDHDDEEEDERDGLSDKLLNLFNFSFSCAGDRSTVSCMPRWAIIIHKFADCYALAMPLPFNDDNCHDDADLVNYDPETNNYPDSARPIHPLTAMLLLHDLLVENSDIRSGD